MSKRFQFMDFTPKTINSFNITADSHQKIAFISNNQDVRMNVIVRRLLEVGLEEFEKEKPDYFSGPDWEKFKGMLNDV